MDFYQLLEFEPELQREVRAKLATNLQNDPKPSNNILIFKNRGNVTGRNWLSWTFVPLNSVKSGFN